MHILITHTCTVYMYGNMCNECRTVNDNWLHHDIMQVKREEFVNRGGYIIALSNFVQEYLIEVWVEI